MVSLPAAGGACLWCGAWMFGKSAGARYHSRRCRQAAFRVRKRHTAVRGEMKALRFAYADPPYPGKAWMYRDQDSYGGEVDHAALLSRLQEYDGWALSTSSAALRDVLPLCPPAARVCAWVKPIGAASTTMGLHSTWEPLIVVPGRRLQPGKRDWLAAQPARRGGSNLIGRKPEAFCVWLFECLGMVAGDEFEDLYPGTGMVMRCWRALQD